MAVTNQTDLTQGWLRKADGGFLPTRISGYGAQSGKGLGFLGELPALSVNQAE